jgi:hypothetical protein
VETEEDELTKQLASFSAYQRSLGLAAKEPEKEPEPEAPKGIWESFNPWDFNALPSVEQSLAELKAGGVLSAFPIPVVPCSRRIEPNEKTAVLRPRLQPRRSARGSATGGMYGTRRTTF